MDYREKSEKCFCCYPEDWRDDYATGDGDWGKDNNFANNNSWNGRCCERDNNRTMGWNNYGENNHNGMNGNGRNGWHDCCNENAHNNSNHKCCRRACYDENNGHNRKESGGRWCCFCNLFRFRCK